MKGLVITSAGCLILTVVIVILTMTQRELGILAFLSAVFTFVLGFLFRREVRITP